MKKLLSFVLAVAMATSLCCGLLINVGGVASAASTDKELFVYNWGDYIDEDNIAAFEEYYEDKTGNTIKVTYSTFDTNESMITQVTKGEAAADIVCPSEYAIQKLLAENAIEKLDFSKIPNYENIDMGIIGKVDAVFSDMSDYFVPYMWGTLGILYNTKYISEEQAKEAGWGLLWNSTEIEKLDGKIYMKDSIRDAYVAAVLYLKEQNALPAGYENYTVEQLINNTDDALLEKAEEVLVEQKKHLKDYEVDFGKNEMIAERGYVDLAWSGDAFYAMEDGGDNLDYFVPEVGGNIWFDGWVMLKNAKNKDEAYEFINFLCQKDVAMKNSMTIGYTCALDKDKLAADADVIAILEENEYDAEEYFSDEKRYPELDTASLGVMKDFGARYETVTAMWERVKASGSKIWILIVVIVVIVVVIAGIVVFFVLKNKRGGRRIVKKAPAKVLQSEETSVSEEIKEEADIAEEVKEDANNTADTTDEENK